MGLYDTVICEYTIKGGLPDWVKKHSFQTKDLECRMGEYRILADGSFSETLWTGMLNFYTSNVVGSGPGIYTEKGEDAEYLDCVAKIVGGRVAGEIEVERSSHKAWPVSKMSIYRTPTEEDVQRAKERRAEHLTGNRLYVLWGGQDVGYWVNVVTENDKEICVAHEADSKYHRAGDFEIIRRYHRDHIFWDSETEALDRNKKRKEDWSRQREEFEAFKAS